MSLLEKGSPSLPLTVDTAKALTRRVGIMVQHASNRQSGIYAITQVATGMQYIGSAKDFAHRWGIHRSDLINGKHHSRFLQRVFNKYGWDALDFSVLEYVEDVSQLLVREQWYLDDRYARKGSHEFNSATKAGSPYGVKRSPELRQKWSEQRKGKRWSEERRAKFRYTEAMQAANANKKGRPVSERQYKALTTVTPNRLAHVRKLVELQKGRPASESRKKHMAEAQQRRIATLIERGEFTYSDNPKAVAARRRKAAKRERERQAHFRATPPSAYEQPPLF